MRNRKRIPAFLMAAVLAAASFPAAAYGEAAESEDSIITEGVAVREEDADQEDSGEVSFSQKEMTCYLGDYDNVYEIPVYFVNGVEDLPYVDIETWADIMVTLYQQTGYDDYELYYEADGPIAQYTRENGYSMLFDFDKQTITFEDYDAFTHVPGDTSLLDMVTSDSTDDDGNPLLFERIEKGSFDRYGKEIELDLTDYKINLYYSEEDGTLLVPLQTMGDFLLSPSLGYQPFFNGEAVYITTADQFLEEDDLSELGYSYYSAPYGDMSEELAWYSYCELCLALDHLYGLKEIHDIRSFDDLFIETDYRENLCSTDPNVKDGALNDFIDYYLDDLHSVFALPSYRTEEMKTIGGSGLSSRQDTATGEIYSEARDSSDRKIPSYEEVGNTAYITFDMFDMPLQPADYYEGDYDVDMDSASETMDTVALILYAHEQINREDSPIENVVIDLSLNGGGALDAAALVCAWYLGEASLSVRSSLTGAVSTGTYRADVNLDGKYDDNDTVSDKNMFCLIGPYSFSCGNLVPNVFKSSRRVTLLGRESGGGSCSILPLSTAYGSTFQISSPYRMSYLKNGSYYDIDTGIEPDCLITKPENFYDREILTEYINKLF